LTTNLATALELAGLALLVIAATLAGLPALLALGGVVLLAVGYRLGE
jgi:hypothetical protein